MPIITQETLTKQTITGQADIRPEEDKPKEEAPSFLDTAAAFARLENPIYNIAKKAEERDLTFDVDQNFDPIAKLEQDDPDLIDHAESFEDVANEGLYEHRVNRIRKENKDRETLQKSSTTANLLAGVATSALDPFMWIPGMQIVKGGKVLTAAGKAAAATAAGEAATQSVLLGTQETRTVQESLTDTVAATALGGLFGGTFAAFSKGQKSSADLLLKKALKGEDVKVNLDDLSAIPKSNSKADLGLANINESVAKAISSPVEALRAPDLRMATSESNSVRKLGEVLYNSNYIRNKNLRGEATLANAQNAISRRDFKVHSTNKTLNDLYLKYTGKGRIRSSITALRGEKVNVADFNERIWNKLTNPEYVDDIPQVNNAAKLIRSDLDQMASELQTRGILGDLDPELAKNYMTRMYDIDVLKVPNNQKSFRDKVGTWLSKHEKDGTVREVPISLDEAKSQADSILTAILKEHPDQIAMSSIAQGFISKGKFTKKRELLIPDNIISDFLHKDAGQIYYSYMHKANRLIEAQDALKRGGFESIEDVVGNIKKDRDLAVGTLERRLKAEGASQETINKELTKLNDKFLSEEELARDGYASILGQLSKPTPKAVRALTSYQYMRLLGGVSISSFPEFITSALRPGGLLKTFRDGYRPMLQSFKTSKLAKEQIADLTGALEMQQDTLLRRWADPTDQLKTGLRDGKGMKALDTATEVFSKVSLLDKVTLFQREIAGQAATAQAIRTLKKAKLSPKDIRDLAASGIDINDVPALQKSINKYAEEHKGSFLPNFDLWEDVALRDKFKNAIQTEIESTVLKPGAESLPIVIQKYPWARVVWQFKSYMSAATNKIFLSTLQRRDAESLFGIAALVGMGTLSGVTHDFIAGREPPENAQQAILEGFSRSGILGLWGTSALDMGLTMADPKRGRFAGKYGMSIMTGPSVSQIQDMFDVVKRTADGDLKESDKKAILRLLPFQNLFYTKGLAEKLAED